MKKFSALAFTIILAIAATVGTVSASAEDGISLPESFASTLSLDGAADYAVTEDKFAFADKNIIYVYACNESTAGGYTNGTLTSYTHTSAVNKLEYYGDNLYFYDAELGCHLLSEELEASDADFEFTEYSQRIMSGDYVYYIESGNLMIFSFTTGTVTKTDGEFSDMKQTDYGIYVLNGDGLYIVEEGAASEISFGYDDFASIESISTANAAALLQQSGSIMQVTVSGGAFLIKIDAEDISGTYFTAYGVSTAAKDTVAQCLLKSGNAAMIVYGGNAYLTLASNVTDIDYNMGQTEFNGGYTLTDVSVYSRPYACGATKTGEIESGCAVTVNGLVSGAAFDHDYYSVTYTDGNETVQGYVMCSLLSAYSFSTDNTDAELVSGEKSYETRTQTAILVMVVVVLVIVAIAYITLVGTSDKRKTKHPPEEEQQ